MYKKIKPVYLVVLAVLLVASIVVALFVTHQTPAQTANRPRATPTLVPTATRAIPTATSVPLLPVVNTASVRGLDTDHLQLSGISWVRVSYRTCNANSPTGTELPRIVADDHRHGLHVLLLLCQGAPSGSALFDPRQFNDLQQANADAVECGNEQMKHNTFTTFVSPTDFARFYDLCASAVHKVQPNVPVLMGSLDPLVGGIDIAQLYDQVSYLNQMQSAMNSVIHPGGNWQWRTHAIGLIDSWHNGYPDQFNNVLSVLSFWSQQFGVSLQNGDLGKHVWVVEGTACFKGCGLDPNNSYQIAVAHILTLITDVQTALRYKVPFFFFSDKDFNLNGVLWPIGILDVNGKPKPIRQDLPMGARALEMHCPSGQVRVVDQAQLLATMYQGCSLPANYVSILVN